MIKLILAVILLITGMVFFLISTFGVNKFDRALNRLHAAAIGDTLGLLFVIAALILWKGFSMLSLKLLFVVIFFWLAAPVSSHMTARLEAETDPDLGEIEVEHK